MILVLSLSINFVANQEKKKTTQTYEEGIFISHILQREKLGTQAG